MRPRRSTCSPPSSASAGLSVVDLAAGTGKLTAALVEKVERVRAIEPLAEMLAVLRERVAGAEAIEGSAETMPIPDASADAVVAAQRFHWLAGKALTEVARVIVRRRLRPALEHLPVETREPSFQRPRRPAGAQPRGPHDRSPSRLQWMEAFTAAPLRAALGGRVRELAAPAARGPDLGARVTELRRRAGDGPTAPSCSAASRPYSTGPTPHSRTARWSIPMHAGVFWTRLRSTSAELFWNRT